jgi:hypothetical protein
MFHHLFFFVVIIAIHSCNPICILEDDAMSVLELETLKTFGMSHGFDCLDDNVGHRCLVHNVPSDKFATVEVHKLMSSSLIL